MLWFSCDLRQTVYSAGIFCEKIVQERAYMQDTSSASMAGEAIIVDKGHRHMHRINTYLLCNDGWDCLLRFTIFI